MVKDILKFIWEERYFIFTVATIFALCVRGVVGFVKDLVC